MLEKYLEEIGLSEKESQIYLALLAVDSESSFEGREWAITAHEEFYEMHDSKAREGYFIYNKDMMNDTYTAAYLNLARFLLYTFF